MYVTLDHTEDIAANIQTFWFRPARPVRYTAGQFTEMYLPHDNADKRGQKHWFTLSSSPSEELLAVTTKFASQHGSTFKQTLHGLRPGATVMFADPMGDFVLPKDTSTPIVMIAGGIGVTPMRSMIRWLSDTNEQRDIQLLYTTGRPEEVAFKDLFTSYLGNHFTHVLTTPDKPLTAQTILEKAASPGETLFYLSGPQPMLEALAKALKDAGVASHNIVTDYFPGYIS